MFPLIYRNAGRSMSWYAPGGIRHSPGGRSAMPLCFRANGARTRMFLLVMTLSGALTVGKMGLFFAI